METEIADRYNVLRLNYSAVESEKEALRLKLEELSLSSAADKVRLAEVQKQLEVEKVKTADLSEAKEKWEAEATHLRNLYETPEGFINVAIEEAVFDFLFGGCSLWKPVCSFEHACGGRNSC